LPCADPDYYCQPLSNGNVCLKTCEAIPNSCEGDELCLPLTQGDNPVIVGGGCL